MKTHKEGNVAHGATPGDATLFAAAISYMEQDLLAWCPHNCFIPIKSLFF